MKTVQNLKTLWPLFMDRVQLSQKDSLLFTMQGRMVDLKLNRATSRERNFIEQMKVPIFLE